MTKFGRAVAGDAMAVPPIWMMRQAGRYQASYQALRKQHSFEALCRTPELAAAVTLAPVKEFDFDAAILFSDLLFPLEALGFGLSYDAGPPALDGRLTPERVAAFRTIEDALPRLMFQRDAMAAARAVLPADKALLGFVGGPWTLFVYAMEGTHSGALALSKSSPDLYRRFADRMVPLLCENIRLQFEGGADIVMIFDTAAGELAPAMMASQIAPDLVTLARAFPSRLGYYAKGSHPSQVPALVDGALTDGALTDGGAGFSPPNVGRAEARPSIHHDPGAASSVPWAGMGFDARWDMASVLTTRPGPGFVQGNFDPALLLCRRPHLDEAIAAFVDPLRRLDAQARRGWICGLGHGVLPGTPEDHVRAFISAVREAFQ